MKRLAVTITALAAMMVTGGSAHAAGEHRRKAPMTSTTVAALSRAAAATGGHRRPVPSEAAMKLVRSAEQSYLQLHHVADPARVSAHVKWAHGRRISAKRWSVTATVGRGVHRLRPRWLLKLPLEELIRTNEVFSFDESMVQPTNAAAERLSTLPRMKPEPHKPIALFVGAIGLSNGRLDAAVTTTTIRDPTQYLESDVSARDSLRGLAWATEHRLNGEGRTLIVDDNTRIFVRGTGEQRSLTELEALFTGDTLLIATAVWAAPPTNVAALGDTPLSQLEITLSPPR